MRRSHYSGVEPRCSSSALADPPVGGGPPVYSAKAKVSCGSASPGLIWPVHANDIKSVLEVKYVLQ